MSQYNESSASPSTALGALEAALDSGQAGRRPADDQAVAGLDRDGLAAELAEVVRGEVRFDDGTRHLYANDASIYRQVPVGVVIPKDADDVVMALRCCHRYGAPILARGCGTGLAGQSVNVAVMVDFSKYMNNILELDAEAGTARVQPGVICDQLRDAAGEHGLTFAPDPATHDHCTLGGMIGNNSCGTHSVMGGKTVDNVISMEVITYDGTRMRVGPTSEEEWQAVVADGGRPGEIYRQLADLRDRYAGLVAARYPDIPRRVSGYNLDDLAVDKGFNLARALVGSESTCVLVLEATVRLLPDPPHHALLVAGFPDGASAAEAVPAGRETNVIGLEFFDLGVVTNLKAKGARLPGMDELPEGRAWLLAEYGGDTRADADAKAEQFAERLRQGGTGTVKLFDNPDHEGDIWEVRRAAIGSTRIPGSIPGWPVGRTRRSTRPAWPTTCATSKPWWKGSATAPCCSATSGRAACTTAWTWTWPRPMGWPTSGRFSTQPPIWWSPTAGRCQASTATVSCAPRCSPRCSARSWSAPSASSKPSSIPMGG